MHRYICCTTAQIVRVTGYGRAALRGELPYHATAGRVPRSAGEVALGPRLADEFGVHVGDRVELTDLAGHRFTKTVSGIVVVPTLEDEPLGRNVLMTLPAPAPHRDLDRLLEPAGARGRRAGGVGAAGRSRAHVAGRAAHRAEHDRRAEQARRARPSC